MDFNVALMYNDGLMQRKSALLESNRLRVHQTERRILSVPASSQVIFQLLCLSMPKKTHLEVRSTVQLTILPSDGTGAGHT